MLTPERARKLREDSPRQVSADQLDQLIGENQILRESFEEAAGSLLALRAEDEGWAPLNARGTDDEFTLSALKEIHLLAEVQTTGNPLLKRGLSLRTSNVFGRGLTIEGSVTAKVQEILDRPGNKRVLFSEEGFNRNERAIYTGGNLFMAYHIPTNSFFPIPLREITNSASNPDRKENVWFYQRSWVSTDPATGLPAKEESIEWYPVLERWEHAQSHKQALPTSIGPTKQKVNSDYVIIDFKANLAIGQIWGVPDVLPAMAYAWAHAEYVRDAAKLLKALSMIAWKVVAKSKAGTANAAAAMSAPKNVGSTATMSDGTDLVSMPRSGQVNMADGQTIAAYVASALEVSLLALLPDSANAGSYGAAATLDTPTANAARSRQALWADFYERIYRAAGAKKIVVTFAKILEDPGFRQAQSLTLVRAAGGLWQDEYREATAAALGVDLTHDGVPPMEEYAPAGGALQILLEQMREQADVEANANEAEQIARLEGKALAGAAITAAGGTDPNAPTQSTPTPKKTSAAASTGQGRATKVGSSPSVKAPVKPGTGS